MVAAGTEGSMTDDMLRQLAAELRVDVFRMIMRAGSGHIDSSFSVLDIITTLYFAVMNIRPAYPGLARPGPVRAVQGPRRSGTVRSPGQSRDFPREDLRRLRQPGSHLQGHPRTATPGVDAPSGSLGQGLSIAVGMALALALEPCRTRRVFAVLSDGELDEGQTWEAIAFAGELKPGNLVAIIDHNGREYSTRSKPGVRSRGTGRQADPVRMGRRGNRRPLHTGPARSAKP